jgi:hypothetical protein
VTVVHPTTELPAGAQPQAQLHRALADTENMFGPQPFLFLLLLLLLLQILLLPAGAQSQA